MRKNKPALSKTGRSLPTGIAWGVVTAVVLSLLLIVLLSNLMLNSIIAENRIAIVIHIIRALSVMVGSLVGGIITRGKYMLQVGITTLCYLLLVLSAGVVLYGVDVVQLISGVTTAILGGAVALLILVRPKKKSYGTAKLT